MLPDLRYAVRSFLKTPAFTLIVVLTIALGIGANTAIFTVVNAVLLRPFPYDDPSTLFRIRRGSSFPDMQDVASAATSVSVVGGFRPQLFDYADGDSAERLDGALLTGQMLEVLGARPLLGRLIAAADDLPGSEPVVVISSQFWRTRLGGDPRILGRRVTLSATSYTVVGVMAEEFELPATKADVFAAFAPLADRERTARGAHTLRAFVRLAPGATVVRAQQELDAVAARLEREYPDTNREVRFVLQPLVESIAGSARSPLMILLATVGVVLLIACVNVANLLLARGAARRAELAVRAAIGATRGRLARQLLTETLLLAVVGGALAVAVAHWLTRIVIAVAPEEIPRLASASIDGSVLAFTGALSIVTGLVFGVLPAWSSASLSMADAAGASGRTTPVAQRSRALMMVFQSALAFVLVVGAGLLLRSFVAVMSQEAGFDPAGVVTGNINLNGPRYGEVAVRVQLFEQLEERIARLPGVTSVALTTDLPIGGTPIFHNLAFEGRPMQPGTEPEVYYRAVNAGYFRAMGIPLTDGRAFTEHDRAASEPVAIVNASFVREYYPAEHPVGRRIRWASGDGTWITIVGVSADVRGLSLERAEVPAVYVPYAQEQMPWRRWMDVAVRTAAAPAAVARAVASELRQLDPQVPLARVRTMEQVIEGSTADRWFNLVLLAAFAALALLLAAAGIYGVMSYAVQQRTREMAVRLALGARPAAIMGLVVRRAVALALAGVVAGAAVAAALSRVLAGMLFETAPTDPLAFATAAVVLLGAACVASYVPARRAMRVNPIVALRSE